MAPFIPEGVVNPDLNLFFALILGLGFGYVLEQAGFSSSRKLAGVFYGYDFVVLKVFFTAGVTAMVGLSFLGFMGWIDMSLVYINPTYLWPAIVGGVIMGFGFIMGGYCPGTSLVAATTGKADAMLFILGAVAGIFIFGHYYNQWEPFYNGSYLGSPFIYEMIGIPGKWFAFLLVLMAVAAFAITQKIEDNVNKTPEPVIAARPSYFIPGGLLILAMFAYIFLPSERKSNSSEISAAELHALLQSDQRFVSAEEAIYKIMTQNSDLILIDVRQPDDFQRFALPGAVNIPPEEMLGRRYRSFFGENRGKKVFYGFSETAADLSWAVATRAGFDGVYVLQGGLNGLFSMLFINPESPADPLDMEQNFSTRFMAKARRMFQEGKALPASPSAPVPVRKIVDIEAPAGRGGC
jgi:rhodanese-related sulfurtransferase/uncharacterized membrane protein YedE/YeeE